MYKIVQRKISLYISLFYFCVLLVLCIRKLPCFGHKLEAVRI